MEREFEQLYNFMRLAHYKMVFAAVKERPGSLSATEAFSAEVIYLLGEPTVNEFAEFLGISQPNASYKVSALVSKGYIDKTAGSDKREFRLTVTDKFRGYYGASVPDIDMAVHRAGFSENEREQFAAMLSRVAAAIYKEG